MPQARKTAKSVAADASSRLPKYRQLSQLLHERIATGTYRPGTRIPGDFQMAEEFGVSRITVRQAIAQLQKEGYVDRKPGLGTFVNLPAERVVRTGNEALNIVMLYADAPVTQDYNLWQVRLFEKQLSQHNAFLSVASFDASTVGAAEYPAILQSRKIDGALIDGFVHNFHCASLEKIALPYVVVGNHPVDRRYPQVKHDFVKTTANCVAHANALAPGAPVALLVEPFRLYYTNEIYTGYERGIAALAQPRPLLFPCPDDAGENAVDMLVQQQDRFSIVTTPVIMRRVLRRYRELSLSPERCPIVVVGSDDRLSPEDAASVHQWRLLYDRSVKLVIDNLLNAIRYGQQPVYIELEGKLNESSSPASV